MESCCSVDSCSAFNSLCVNFGNRTLAQKHTNSNIDPGHPEDRDQEEAGAAAAGQARPPARPQAARAAGPRGAPVLLPGRAHRRRPARLGRLRRLRRHRLRARRPQRGAQRPAEVRRPPHPEHQPPERRLRPQLRPLKEDQPIFRYSCGAVRTIVFYVEEEESRSASMQAEEMPEFVTCKSFQTSIFYENQNAT